MANIILPQVEIVDNLNDSQNFIIESGGTVYRLSASEISGAIDLSQYYTKDQVYNKNEVYSKSQVYSKEEVYTKNEVDSNLVVINLEDSLSGITATLTGKNGNVYSGTSNSEGLIVLIVPEYDTYTINYSDGDLQSDIDEIIINMPRATHFINAFYGATYTIKIDLTNSNPSSCCSYEDDAVGMTAGSDDWDSMPIFKDIKPCVFKDGEVNYYLNPNDFTLKEDETAAVLTGADGDVMIEFPKFAFKIETDTANNILTVSITNNKNVVANDNTYKYYAFARDSIGDLDHFYYGAFKGSLDSDGKLRSVSGATPTNNKTLAAFEATAQLNGTNYHIVNYFQLVALQCLYLIKYKNLDGQTALGYGYVGGSAAQTTGATITKGMYYGSTSSQTDRVKFAGVEDFWGNIWERIDGFVTTSSWDIQTKVAGQTFTYDTGVSSDIYGYTSKVSGTTESGFKSIGYSGSETTYWSDYGALYDACILHFGGVWSGGLMAGPFRLNADVAASAAFSDVGVRLSHI